MFSVVLPVVCFRSAIRNHPVDCRLLWKFMVAFAVPVEMKFLAVHGQGFCRASANHCIFKNHVMVVSRKWKTKTTDPGRVRKNMVLCGKKIIGVSATL